MKRDMDLIRKILFHVEKCDNLQFAIEGYEEQCVAYHVRLLVEAGLLHAVAQTCLSGTIVLQECGHTGLTWAGHEFLEASRDEGLWTKAKMAAGSTGGMVLDVLKSVLIGLTTEAAKKAAGLL
jgi:hypothetical protein